MFQRNLLPLLSVQIDHDGRNRFLLKHPYWTSWHHIPRDTFNPCGHHNENLISHSVYRIDVQEIFVWEPFSECYGSRGLIVGVFNFKNTIGMWEYYDDISCDDCPFQMLGQYVEIGCDSHLFQILGQYLGLGYDKHPFQILLYLPLSFNFPSHLMLLCHL